MFLSQETRVALIFNYSKSLVRHIKLASWSR